MPKLSKNRERTAKNVEKATKNSQKYRKTFKNEKKARIKHQKYQKTSKNRVNFKKTPKMSKHR